MTVEPRTGIVGSPELEGGFPGFVFSPLQHWAAGTPHKLAVIGQGFSLTYRELEERTNQVASALRSRGIGPGDRVAFVLPRGPETILLLIGILKSGAAYVPLDSESPRDRVIGCLEDSSPSLLVADQPDWLQAGEPMVPAVPSTALWQEAAQHATEPLPLDGLDPFSLAYIIFTSGSTGRPKGVPITHAGLANFVHGNQQTCIRLVHEDRVFQGFSPSSDGHHEEVWPTFLVGATLVVASSRHVHSGPDLREFLDEHQVTVVSCAPTLLSMVDDDVPSIRRILFGAEYCPPTMVERWWKPDREILNTYGPTEATVGATFSVCRPGEPITIGRPLPGYTCTVLDEELNPVPLGSEGELAIAGVGVSRGYWGRDDLSLGKFMPDPFVKEGNEPWTLYRTGDRVRIDEDGNLVWLGRIDAQVKIRGHRIELTEIEAHMGAHPAIQSVVVVPRSEPGREDHLAALMVLREDAPLEVADYLAGLRAVLPAYMIPQVLEEVDRIPVLASGKVDRRSCQEMHGAPIKVERDVLPPSTETEGWILGIWRGLFPDTEISCSDDFFRDLGGYSLLASKFISVLRSDHGYHDLSVVEIYENPTVRSFSAVLDSREKPQVETIEFKSVDAGRYRKAKVVQALGILFLFGFQGVFWLGPVIAAIYYSNEGLTDFQALVLAFVLHAVSVPLMLFLAIAVKWIVGGRFKPGRYPLWGTTFLRWWFVQHVLATVPVAFLTGTPFAGIVLRMLGARIGKNVTFESLEVDCPDMVTVGDDTSFENSSWIHATEVTQGELIIRPVVVGKGCSIGVRSGVCGGAVLNDGVSLRDLTCVGSGVTVPEGEEWEGSPARRAKDRLIPEYDPGRTPASGRLALYAWVQAACVAGLMVLDSIPFLTVTFLLYNMAEDPILYLWEPVFAIGLLVMACVQTVVVKWAVLGRLKPGTYPFPGKTWLRKWFAEKHLELQSSVIVPVYDSLFARPWCIALGMKCGPRCEIALPRRMPYDLVEMGEESFLASEVSIGRPVRRNGQITLERTTVGRRSFLGNDSVVPQACHVPDEFLLGVLSVCPPTSTIGDADEQAWLGSPPFKMPSRQVVDSFDVKRTYLPSRRLYAERLLHEGIRSFLPSLCFLIIASMLIECFVTIWNETSFSLAVLCSPLLYLMGAGVAALLCRGSKAILIGTYRPTVQPLWSQFVWKTETHSAVLHDFGVPMFIGTLVGTPYLSAFMRMLGAKVGRRAFINTTDWTETDLIHIGADVAVNANAPLQAHLFEDRVMKVGPIRIGDRCTVGNYSVILCESELKSDAHVGHLSLVMKGETIPAHTYWEGSPAQARAGELPSN